MSAKLLNRKGVISTNTLNRKNTSMTSQNLVRNGGGQCDKTKCVSCFTTDLKGKYVCYECAKNFKLTLQRIFKRLDNEEGKRDTSPIKPLIDRLLMTNAISFPNFPLSTLDYTSLYPAILMKLIEDDLLVYTTLKEHHMNP